MEPPLKTDAEWLALSIDHPSAFGVLVNRYQKEFLAKVTFMLKNKVEAEDIVQEAFVKIYINAKKFKVMEGASFKSWAYKILLNTCYTHCLKQKREKQFLNSMAGEDLDLFSAQDEFEKKMDLDRVLMVISKIPQALGRILTLNIVQGKSYEDIAVEEKVSEGAIRTRIHRAKNEFKKVSKLYAE
ncbi:MAG: RNA polymerase sigma factor [Patescibacteria group bacterium]